MATAMRPRQDFERLLNDAQASALLGLHPKTLQELACTGHDLGCRQPRHQSLQSKRPDPRPSGQSVRDWAHVRSAPANGAGPEELIAQLAHSRANDKSNPQYYARLTVTKALADLRMPNSFLSGSSAPSSEDEREAQQQRFRS